MAAHSSRAVVSIDEACLVLFGGPRGTEWAFVDRQQFALPPLATTSRKLRASWPSDAALDCITDELDSRHFCIIDNFLLDDATNLREEILGVQQLLKASELSGGRTGNSDTAYLNSELRGDRIGWFTGEEADLWPRGALPSYLDTLDSLIQKLGARKHPELASIAHRSKAMVACYPGGGSRYRRHFDNSCEGSEGEQCNGRRLTAILYLNDAWAFEDGGELRLYKPFSPAAASAKLAEMREWCEANMHNADAAYVARRVPELKAELRAVSSDDGPPIYDVAPLMNRLVLFYSDYRMPHEVLAAQKERLAVTTWYFDEPEHARARKKDALGVEASESEQFCKLGHS